MQHKARLGHRALESVDQQDAAVGHVEHALHLAAEVGVARRVDDVDFYVAVADGNILRKDGNAALALQVVVVEYEFARLLVLAEEVAGHQHLVHERGFPVVNVSDDGNVADLLHVHRNLSGRARRQRLSPPEIREARADSAPIPIYISYNSTAKVRKKPETAHRRPGGPNERLVPRPPVPHGPASLYIIRSDGTARKGHSCTELPCRRKETAGPAPPGGGDAANAISTRSASPCGRNGRRVKRATGAKMNNKFYELTYFTPQKINKSKPIPVFAIAKTAATSAGMRPRSAARAQNKGCHGSRHPMR